jgi:hypothetical protein
VQHHDVLFEVLQKIIHLTLIDRVNTNLRYHFIFPPVCSCFPPLGQYTMETIRVRRQQSTKSDRAVHE